MPVSSAVCRFFGSWDKLEIQLSRQLEHDTKIQSLLQESLLGCYEDVNACLFLEFLLTDINNKEVIDK